MIDQQFLEDIPPSLLMNHDQIKLLDCIGQGKKINKIDHHKLLILLKLGEFAKVYAGHYYNNGQCTTVAVKTLKGLKIKPQF